MTGLILTDAEQVAWKPHPRYPGARIATLLPRLDNGPAMQCFLIEMAPETQVPEHVHDDDDDILFILRGTAKMWIEGQGEIDLYPGKFVRIPKGVRHRPYGFSQDFRIFNTWAANPASPNP